MVATASRIYKMTVQARGQVTLPKSLRDEMELQPGDRVIAERDEHGNYVMRRYQPMSIDEMFARWGDPTPVSFEEVERQIQEARDAYADELALDYAE